MSAALAVRQPCEVTSSSPAWLTHNGAEQVNLRLSAHCDDVANEKGPRPSARPIDRPTGCGVWDGRQEPTEIDGFRGQTNWRRRGADSTTAWINDVARSSKTRVNHRNIRRRHLSTTARRENPQQRNNILLLLLLDVGGGERGDWVLGHHELKPSVDQSSTRNNHRMVCVSAQGRGVRVCGEQS